MNATREYVPPILGYVVAFGNPISGFKLHGPFPTHEAADKWAEDCGEGGEWVMPINGPDPFRPYPWSTTETAS